VSALEPIVGRYLTLDLDGTAHRVYFEEAGQGPPLICLHTAGADSRQYRYLLNDGDVTSKWRVLAFDLPWHGRSNPGGEWWLNRWRLSAALYERIVMAFISALDLQRPVVMGCSMGGVVVLRLAAHHGAQLGGVIGLESTTFVKGRSMEYLHHPAVHGGEFVATYTAGLCAPQSPEPYKRESWWYYAQGGPGVYVGDLYFYAEEYDAATELARIDTAHCPVELLTGEYDYSCTPELTLDTAKLIRGAQVTIMKAMGHFPMIENYPEFRGHLLPALRRILQRSFQV